MKIFTMAIPVERMKSKIQGLFLFFEIILKVIERFSFLLKERIHIQMHTHIYTTFGMTNMIYQIKFVNDLFLAIVFLNM